MVVYQYQQGSGTKGETVTLNGNTYYSTTVPISANLTTLTCKGIGFAFTLGIQEELSPPKPYTQFSGLTRVTVPCSPGVQGGAELCTEFLPQIQISFPDGSVEYFNKAFFVNTTVTYHPPVSYPWFSTHADLRVAIMLNTNSPTASLTLCVSI